LSKLQDACFEAIKVAALESSGIRSGDSYWHGGDAVGETLRDLENVCASLRAAYNPPPDEENAKPGLTTPRGRLAIDQPAAVEQRAPWCD
jgi:hypothetical protein